MGRTGCAAGSREHTTQAGMRQWVSDLEPRAQTGQVVECWHQLAGNLQRVDPGKLQIRTEGHVQAGVFSVQEPAIESRVMRNNPKTLQLAGQGGGDLCEDRALARSSAPRPWIWPLEAALRPGRYGTSGTA